MMRPCSADEQDEYGAELFDAAPYMESFLASGEWTDAAQNLSDSLLAPLHAKWREVHVDVGAALKAGAWSGNTSVVVNARSLLLQDYMTGATLVRARERAPAEQKHAMGTACRAQAPVRGGLPGQCWCRLLLCVS